ncbi:hypothetical protein BBAD15_g5093 [Beauveria bassiana D1-5]|uniref:Uncharacterized protein n=1 Tax=Beauveria bassiana D1-5 TaxID=1245745 RepID=A0A0A2VTB0_BEABA|nr:hypothetical protein BBAD15_g5093 [Beauveria bassiana D1-5]
MAPCLLDAAFAELGALAILPCLILLRHRPALAIGVKQLSETMPSAATATYTLLRDQNWPHRGGAAALICLVSHGEYEVCDSSRRKSKSISTRLHKHFERTKEKGGFAIGDGGGGNRGYYIFIETAECHQGCEDGATRYTVQQGPERHKTKYAAQT